MNGYLKRGVWLALLLALPAGPAPAQPGEPDGAVYVIPVQGMIEPALVYVIRRGVKEAEAAKARALILELETPGGAVSALEDIITILQKVTIPTYALVNKNAISAGAVMALATRHIYMTPGSKIGDAMPIMASPTGAMQPLPDAEREKITSYVDGIIRSVAEQNGHDKQLASKMVRREPEYKIGSEVICPAGQILTLTNLEAERPVGKDKHPLLSLGTVAGLEEMLTTAGLGDARVITLEVTRAEEIARFIAALAPLFMMAGMLGLYIEFKTPGFGLPGTLGLISLAIFLWGHHIAGLAGMEDLVFLLIGLMLILIEILFFPGYGLIGTLGAVIVAGALLSAMIENLPGDPILPAWPQIEVPLYKLMSSFVLTAIGAGLLARYLPESPLFRRLVLHETTSQARGFSSSRPTDRLLGQRGTADSDLRPAGLALIGEEKVDVVTRGEFIAHGSAIRVVETHGSRIVVEQDGA